MNRLFYRRQKFIETRQEYSQLSTASTFSISCHKDDLKVVVFSFFIFFLSGLRYILDSWLSVIGWKYKFPHWTHFRRIRADVLSPLKIPSINLIPRSLDQWEIIGMNGCGRRSNMKVHIDKWMENKLVDWWMYWVSYQCQLLYLIGQNTNLLC